MSSSARSLLLLVAAAAVMTVSILVGTGVERNVQELSARESAMSAALLTGMLDQETGLRGFALTARPDFLQPFLDGRRDFNDSSARLRLLISDQPREQAVLRDATATAGHWRRLAEAEVAHVRRVGPQKLRLGTAARRKRVMDQFRRVQRQLNGELDRNRRHELARAAAVPVAIVVLQLMLFGALGYLLVFRNARLAARRREGENAFRRTQREFAETLQVSESEGEAHDLIKRHLERRIPASQAVVLNRNNSADRLIASTELPEASPLRDKLSTAKPRSCMAVRLGHEFERNADEAPLLDCEVCGGGTDRSSCTPLLVGSTVIGSVLVSHPVDLHEDERRRVSESVAQAAPVLANLRNLAIAETRASTDVLTGLPNRRAADETMRRMLAYAGRSLTPLAIVSVDLDHFKQINDTHGHEKGDSVLAAAADALRASVRTSDFAARIGGEEFVVLLPDTDRDGGAQVAEKLRQALARTVVGDLNHRITGSFGVCAYPQDAVDHETLLRLADRALYAAKQGGRNRVEVAGTGHAAALVEPDGE